MYRYDLRLDRGVSWAAACAVRGEAVRRLEEAAEGEELEHDHKSGFYIRACTGLCLCALVPVPTLMAVGDRCRPCSHPGCCGG